MVIRKVHPTTHMAIYFPTALGNGHKNTPGLNTVFDMRITSGPFGFTRPYFWNELLKPCFPVSWLQSHCSYLAHPSACKRRKNDNATQGRPSIQRVEKRRDKAPHTFLLQETDQRQRAGCSASVGLGEGCDSSSCGHFKLHRSLHRRPSQCVENMQWMVQCNVSIQEPPFCCDQPVVVREEVPYEAFQVLASTVVAGSCGMAWQPVGVKNTRVKRSPAKGAVQWRCVHPQNSRGAYLMSWGTPSTTRAPPV